NYAKWNKECDGVGLPSEDWAGVRRITSTGGPGKRSPARLSVKGTHVPITPIQLARRRRLHSRTAARPLLHPAHLGRRPHHRIRSEEHTSELQSRFDLVCRLLLEKKT